MHKHFSTPQSSFRRCGELRIRARLLSYPPATPSSSLPLPAFLTSLPSPLLRRRWVREGVRDFSISRAAVSWGIPVPRDPKQTVYVWFDALNGYLSGEA